MLVMGNVSFVKFPKPKFRNKEDEIAFTKFINDFFKQAKIAAKGEDCLICKEKQTSFCNSHSLPQFILNSIAEHGYVKCGKEYILSDGTKKIGLKECLTFHNICCDCDGKYFKEYEDESFLDKKVNDIFINEVSIKNELRFIYKRTHEINLFKKIIEAIPSCFKFIADFYQNELQIKEIDLRESKELLKMMLRRKDERLFYVIDDINLTYKTKLAYQGFITIINDFDNNLVNDTYNLNENYKMQKLGIMVFPYSRGTKIIVYCKDGSTRLRPFYKKFRGLSREEKTYVINYILMLYEEEWCLDPKFDMSKLNKETKDLIMQSTILEFISDQPIAQDAQRSIKSINKAENISLFKIKTSGSVYNFLADNQ